MITKQEALELVKAKKLRMVSAKRKRTLRKKGISVWWMKCLDSYVWEMK